MTEAEKIAALFLKPDYMAAGTWFNYKLGDEYKRALKAIDFALSVNGREAEKSWWAILGLTSNASVKEIKSAYMSRAEILDPRKSTGNKEKFIELSNALAEALKKT